MNSWIIELKLLKPINSFLFVLLTSWYNYDVCYTCFYGIRNES